MDRVMWGFGNKNKKLDPRVRFQHTSFTRKLSEARNYKRTVKQKPEGKLAELLSKVGLASLVTQLFLAALLIIVVYLLYVPNPLYVKNVRVEGVTGNSATAVQEAVNELLSEHPWYVPGYNLLFINSEHIAKGIQDKVPAIWKIEAIEKSYRNRTIVLKVTEKYERYAVVRNDDQLVLYNDGTVHLQLPAPTSIPSSGSLVTVVVKTTSGVPLQSAHPGERYISDELITLIEQAASEFTAKTGQDFAYFEIDLAKTNKQLAQQSATETAVSESTTSSAETEPVTTEALPLPVPTPEVETQPLTQSWKAARIFAVLNKRDQHAQGSVVPAVQQLRLVVEPGMNIFSAANRLNELLAQTQPERYRNLYYIDLRLENRAFLCLLHTACAVDAD